MKAKALERLKKKIHLHDPVRKTWCGYLTTIERIYILELLPELTDHDVYELKWAKEDRDKGKSSSTWFYFKYYKEVDHLLSKPMEIKKHARS